MGIENAVLVGYSDDYVWCWVQGSIDEFGRIEGYISVDTSDIGIAQQIGDEYLSKRAWPLVSHVVEISPDGPVVGDEFKIGETLTAGADSLLLCVGATWGLDGDGTWRRVPELSSPLEEDLARSERVYDRLVALAGGTSRASAPPISTGSGVPTGKLGSINIPSWSWSSSGELDDQFEPDVEEGDGGQFGQPYKMEEPARLYEWVITCKAFDNDGEQLTIGPTEFEIYIDNAPLVPPFIITIGETEEEGRQDVFGPALLMKETKIAPRNLTNGGHEGGSITMRATDPT